MLPVSFLASVPFQYRNYTLALPILSRFYIHSVSLVCITIWPVNMSISIIVYRLALPIFKYYLLASMLPVSVLASVSFQYRTYTLALPILSRFYIHSVSLVCVTIWPVNMSISIIV